MLHWTNAFSTYIVIIIKSHDLILTPARIMMHPTHQSPRGHWAARGFPAVRHSSILPVGGGLGGSWKSTGKSDILWKMWQDENRSYGMILMEYWWIIWISLQPINTWGSFVVGSNPTAAENWKTNRTIWEWRMMWATSMKSLETTQHSSGLSLETTQYKQHITS